MHQNGFVARSPGPCRGEHTAVPNTPELNVVNERSGEEKRERKAGIGKERGEKKGNGGEGRGGERNVKSSKQKFCLWPLPNWTET